MRRYSCSEAGSSRAISPSCTFSVGAVPCAGTASGRAMLAPSTAKPSPDKRGNSVVMALWVTKAPVNSAPSGCVAIGETTRRVRLCATPSTLDTVTSATATFCSLMNLTSCRRTPPPAYTLLK
ncbi:hypothetical protein NB689_002671 [Xanthomonas sacchari]|nr:hypothetical protein [Xanthomonas sacchari]